MEQFFPNLIKKIKKLDIFGKSIDLTFNTNRTHKTCCGAIITIFIFLLLLVVFIILIRQTYVDNYSDIATYNKSLPLESIQFPQNYDDFFVAVNFPNSLYNENFISFSANLIYQIQNYQSTSQDLLVSQFDIINCQNITNFIRDEEKRNNLFKLNLQDWFCIDLYHPKRFFNLQPIFGEEVISKQIVIEIVATNKDNANSDLYQNYISKLKNLSLNVLYLNKIEQPQERKYPFKSVLQRTKISFGSSIVQHQHLTLKQVDVLVDNGIYFNEDFKKKFSYIIEDLHSEFSELIQPPNISSSVEYQAYIQIDLSNIVREHKIKSLKIYDILGVIGGMFKSMVFIGVLIAQPFSTISLTTSIVNSIFNFQTNEEINRQKKSSIFEQGGQYLLAQQNLEFFPEDVIDENNGKSYQSKKDASEATPVRKPSLAVISLTHSPSPEYRQQQQQDKTVIIQNMLKEYSVSKNISHQTMTQIQKIKGIRTPHKKLTSRKEYSILFKKLFKESKKVQMFFCDYFKWIFHFHSSKKRQITFSSAQVQQRLDVIYILNKLVEIDKLKLLLLNNDQLKLFDYLPKPVVGLCGENITYENEIQEAWWYINQDKSDIDKAGEAYKAYRSITTNNNLSPIDKKLIDMLDSKIKTYFGDCNNNPDTIRVNTTQKESPDSAQIYQHNFDKSIAVKTICNLNNSKPSQPLTPPSNCEDNIPSELNLNTKRISNIFQLKEKKNFEFIQNKRPSTQAAINTFSISSINMEPMSDNTNRVFYNGKKGITQTKRIDIKKLTLQVNQSLNNLDD